MIRWRPHNGNRCPVGGEQFIHLKLRCGWETPLRQAGKFRWSHQSSPGDIIAWREG